MTESAEHGGGDRGHDHHGHVDGGRDGLGGVEDLAAAHAHDEVGAGRAEDLHEAVDLRLGALAVEVVVGVRHTGGIKARGDDVAGTTQAALGDDHERVGAVGLGVLAEAGELAGTLDVLAGADEDACHVASSLPKMRPRRKTRRGPALLWYPRLQRPNGRRPTRRARRTRRSRSPTS